MRATPSEWKCKQTKNMEEGGVKEESGEVSPSRDQLLEDLGNDYSTYLKIDVTQEKQQFEESIEEMLTKLDEYCGLLDVIRGDTSLCLNKTLPEIHRKSQDLQVIFDRIDQLEAFVAVVRGTVNAMEEQVNQAEAQMGTFSSIKKAFNNFSLPFFSAKKSPTDNKPPPGSPSMQRGQSESDTRQNLPEIFKTEDYLHPATPQGSPENSTVKAQEKDTDHLAGENDKTLHTDLKEPEK